MTINFNNKIIRVLNLINIPVDWTNYESIFFHTSDKVECH